MKVVRAELKDIFSPDVRDLNNPGLPEGSAFCVALQVDFGAKGEEGQDQFDMLVCNPHWIAQQTKEGVFSGLHYLIVPEFDIDQIRSFLRELAEQSIGVDWVEVARKLGKFGRWEFEDLDSGSSGDTA